MHKLLLFCLISSALMMSCKTTQKAQQDQPAKTAAVAVPETTPAPAPRTVFVPKPKELVTWDKKKLDLGKVKKGEKRTFSFEFTNVSDADVQIEIVDACSCTTVEFPRGKIAPGGKGKLDAVFDSTEKDATETIGITIVFKNTDASGNPVIESVEYSFELLK